jgi:hypothetical protein
MASKSYIACEAISQGAKRGVALTSVHGRNLEILWCSTKPVKNPTTNILLLHLFLSIQKA